MKRAVYVAQYLQRYVSPPVWIDAAEFDNQEDVAQYLADRRSDRDWTWRGVERVMTDTVLRLAVAR